MIDWENVQITKKRPTSITCSRCQKTYYYNTKNPRDDIEVQEFVGFDGFGGYGSVIEDDVYWQIHLCQHCFVELCGDYLEYPEDNDEE